MPLLFSLKVTSQTDEASRAQALVFGSPFSAPLIPSASLPHPLLQGSTGLVPSSLGHCRGLRPWVQLPAVSPTGHYLPTCPHIASFTLKDDTPSTTVQWRPQSGQVASQGLPLWPHPSFANISFHVCSMHPRFGPVGC